MTIKEIIESHEWTIEQATMALGIDAESLIQCIKNPSKNKWVADLMKNILGQDYDDILI